MTDVRGSGLYATLDGHEYPATSNPNGLIDLFWDGPSAPDGFTPIRVGRWSRTVSPRLLTRLEDVDVRCTWREHRFQVGRVDGDTAVLDLLGDDSSWAAPGVLEEVYRGRWIASAPIEELLDVSEQHVDVLPLNRSKYLDAGSPGVPA